MGNSKKALQYHINYTSIKDSIIKIENEADHNQKIIRYEFEKNELIAKATNEKREVIAKETQQKQKYVIIAVVVILALVTLFTLLLYRRFTITQKQKIIIEIQKNETEEQKHLVEEKQKEIIESITYAKRLQEAILPPQEFINKYVPNNFILYKPKDLVAGDFYWAEQINDFFFIAAADSTGHGVPGAMVSVVCSNALNRTVKEFNLTETGNILDKTRELVLETFEKSTSEVKDGMDISLLCIDNKNKKIFWSGANNPLWYFQDNELKEIKADKQPIGKTEYPKPFTTHSIEYITNTTFFLFTDGFADQFGGPKGKKFKYKQFSDLLVNNINLTQQQQAETIDKVFEDWKGNLEQVDDVCVIGIKI
jgi:serine phosphatase RsbU (regulator of sigma subunit)